MGRLFQYNRFGATDNVQKNISRKDTQQKNKMLRNAIKCPGYSDIYGQYNEEDLSFEKCQQWSHKLQFPAATTTGVVMDKQEPPIQSRTHKVYDSMKNFLQRKLFAQPSHKETKILSEEATSDYDEDLLDSSYQADAEEEEEGERDADCSCSSTSGSSAASSGSPATPKRSPQKSLLSLNCWQSSHPSSDSNPEEEDEEDSDAGISDCCQLLQAENSSSSISKHHRTPLPRYSTSNQNSDEDDDDDEEAELLQCPWYQPRITAKAAAEHLQQATPGSFLLRRSTPRHFEVLLRLERSKVKTYPVQSTRNQMYRLKGAKKQFTSLKALVTHHSVMAEQLPLTLDMPRERHVVKPPSVRYADDFEPLESLQLLGILKSLQARSIEI